MRIFCFDFCLPHATFSIAVMLQGCCLQKPTKYDVNRNSSELFLPDKPVDQVQCYTLKLSKTLSGASIVVIAGEHRAQTNKQTESGQTDRRTDEQTDRKTNKQTFSGRFSKCCCSCCLSLQRLRFMPSSHNLRHCSCPPLLLHSFYCCCCG